MADVAGSSRSAQSSSAAQKKSSAPTLDALTASLQNSRLGEGIHSNLDSHTIKKILLNPNLSQDDIPSLQTLLHDRVWYQGGEAVLLVGQCARINPADASHSSEDFVPPQGVDHVDVAFTQAELDSAIAHIQEAATQGGCKASVIAQNSNHAYIMLRRIPANAQELLELRVAVIGNGM